MRQSDNFLEILMSEVYYYYKEKNNIKFFYSECQEPMGLENKYTGEITASSFYNPSTSPDKARMGSDTAWVAGITNVNQYLQVGI